LLLTAAALHVGEKMTVKALRDGKEMLFEVFVVERKDKSEVVSINGGNGYFGLAVQEITKETAQHMGIPRNAGVIVTDVEEGSPADDIGIQPQDIIAQVNKVKISSIKDYKREISKAAERKSVTLLVKRGKGSFYITLRIE
jgi:serine protease Do